MKLFVTIYQLRAYNVFHSLEVDKTPYPSI